MKLILTILFVVNTISWSQVQMNVKMKDGSTKTFSIEDVRKLTFSGVVGIEEGKKLATIIKTFTLMQNYPNPFNPSTTIEYQIPKAGDVEVNIYDISGQLVKTLEKSFQNAGSYKLIWNSKSESGSNVASGIYLYQVRYNQSVLTKKLILIK